MIITLGGKTHREARGVLRRAIEAIPTPPTTAVSTRARRIERQRMRAKVAGTRHLAGALERAIAATRRDVLHRFGLREADDVARIADAPGQFGFDERHLVKALRPSVRAMFEDGVASATAEVSSLRSSAKREAQKRAYQVSTSFEDFTPQAALDALYQTTLEFSRKVVDRERDALKALLLRAIAQGLTGPQIHDEIREFFDDGIHYPDETGKIVRAIPEDAWIEMVARTEVARAQNAGISATYAYAGIDQVVFITAEDERVCPECDDLDGTTMDVGSEDTPPIHPSCRCTVVAAENYEPGDASDGDD